MKRKTIGTSLGIFSLVLVALATIYWFQLVNQVAIPEDRTPFMILYGLVVVMAVASFIVGTRWFGGIAAVLAILPALFMPLTVAISKQVVADNPIQVGDSLPYFEALNDQSERFTSDALAGTPVLIKFFRGHW